MKAAYFISDVHLSSRATDSADALLSLIRKAQTDASLFVVLGDLFDLWVGDAHILQKTYSDIISEFLQLKKTCRLIYLEGNHDFHLKNFWQVKLGFEVYEGPVDIEFGATKLRLEHGDEADPADKGYIFLRWLLRTAPMKFIAEKTPSRLIVNVGEHASHLSRRYTNSVDDVSKTREIVEKGRVHAKKVSQTKDFDLLVTGHTHVPDDFSFNSSSRQVRLINLGSWFDGPHFLSLSPSGEISHCKIADP